MSKKSTKAEVDRRVMEVCELLSKGYTKSYIDRYCATNFNIGSRQVDVYISEAYKQIKEINTLTLQDNLAIITNQLWDLYRDARANNDRMNANKALAQLAKIKGLEVNSVHHIIEDQRDLVNMTNEDLDKLLEDQDSLQ